MVDPSKPRVHIGYRNSKACIDDQSKDDDRRWSHSLLKLLAMAG